MAVSIKELWEIVNPSEETRKHCMMMENVNYGREELMYLNMVRQLSLIHIFREFNS